jgi:hypothetical protein
MVEKAAGHVKQPAFLASSGIIRESAALFF